MSNKCLTFLNMEKLKFGLHFCFNSSFLLYGSKISIKLINAKSASNFQISIKNILKIS